MPWIAGIVATIATTAASLASANRAAAAGQPKMDSGEGARAEAATLPARRAIEAAAQTGKAYSVPTGRLQADAQRLALAKVPEGSQVLLKGNQWVPYKAADFAPGGQYAKYAQGGQVTARVPETISGSFEGMGEADINAKIADQMAQMYLDTGEKYGRGFVEESKKQLAEADPEGTQARQDLYRLTMEQAARKPDRPVADALERQVNAELAAGPRLSGSAAATAAGAGTAAGASRGQKVDNALLKAEMERGSAGEARARRARQKALGWLTSGQTGEDVGYQREQQSAANLQNFVNGVTPTDQFSQVAGAQRGAAPLATTKALPTMSNNADQAAQQFGLSGWQAKQAQASQTANSWFGALSGLLSAAGSVAAAKQ